MIRKLSVLVPASLVAAIAGCGSLPVGVGFESVEVSPSHRVYFKGYDGRVVVTLNSDPCARPDSAADYFIDDWQMDYAVRGGTLFLYPGLDPKNADHPPKWPFPVVVTVQKPIERLRFEATEAGKDVREFGGSSHPNKRTCYV